MAAVVAGPHRHSAAAALSLAWRNKHSEYYRAWEPEVVEVWHNRRMVVAAAAAGHGLVPSEPQMIQRAPAAAVATSWQIAVVVVEEAFVADCRPGSPAAPDYTALATEPQKKAWLPHTAGASHRTEKQEPAFHTPLAGAVVAVDALAAIAPQKIQGATWWWSWIAVVAVAENSSFHILAAADSWHNSAPTAPHRIVAAAVAVPFPESQIA